MTACPDPVLFKGYRLTNVYGRLGTEATEEVVRMWLKAGVLNEVEARRRCQEVVYTLHDPENSLVGVNTVYIADFITPGQPYYFYRTFIRDADRGVSGLPRTMLSLALAFLKLYPHPRRPAGLAIVTENPKLMRRGAMAILTALGLHRLGRNPRGNDVWYVNFDGSRFGSSLPNSPSARQ